MVRVEQYHTHTLIVHGYKIFSILLPTGKKLKPHQYPMGILTHHIPTGKIYIAKVHTRRYVYGSILSGAGMIGWAKGTQEHWVSVDRDREV
jgi:hypothetical protein